MFRKIADFLLFSSLFIAGCAVLMIWQTTELLFHAVPTGRLVGFVFFSTVCSYNFHWWLTPSSVNPSSRIQWTQRNKGLHFCLYLAGLVGAAVYFISLYEHWAALCFGAFVTFLYSAPKLPQPVFRGLRRIAIGKTIFLATVWTYVTTILPVFVSEATWNGSLVLFAASRFFLIYAICILFDYRDREDDRKDGIRSLITYLDEKGIDKLFIFSLALFTASCLGLYGYHYNTYTIILLLIPGIILSALYSYAKKHFSDYLYYFVLDGLMMFSGLLMLIADI